MMAASAAEGTEAESSHCELQARNYALGMEIMAFNLWVETPLWVK